MTVFVPHRRDRKCPFPAFGGRNGSQLGLVESKNPIRCQTPVVGILNQLYRGVIAVNREDNRLEAQLDYRVNGFDRVKSVEVICDVLALDM
jgi:hypothetical protein